MTLAALERYRSLLDDWAAFTAALARPLPTCIWTNPLRVTPAQLAQLLRDDGFTPEPVAWYPGAFRLEPDFKPSQHWAYQAGLYHVQEEASLLPVVLLDPQPGERILDLCAAPGGKTAQIAIRLNRTGTVVANDINYGRMRAARSTLERLGLVNVTTTILDGANYPRAAGLFDRVLVDVPCTCEGTVRKEPAVLGRIGPAYSCKRSGQQQALLKKAAQLCRPGGRIVYSTCTFAPEENEQVIDGFLREVKNVRVANVLDVSNSLRLTPGVTSWQERSFDSSLVNTGRLWPHHNDTGGFFVAVLEKDGVADETAGPVGQIDFSPVPELVAQVRDRFDFGADDLSRYTFFQRSNRQTHLANPDQQPPLEPLPDAVGMQFIRLRNRYPKLSTAAAMLLGPSARQNVIDLTREQQRAFVARLDVALSAGQLQACTSEGYVLARYQGFVLGVGVCLPAAGVLQSMYPKGWAQSAPAA